MQLNIFAVRNIVCYARYLSRSLRSTLGIFVFVYSYILVHPHNSVINYGQLQIYRPPTTLYHMPKFKLKLHIFSLPTMFYALVQHSLINYYTTKNTTHVVLCADIFLSLLNSNYVCFSLTIYESDKMSIKSKLRMLSFIYLRDCQSFSKSIKPKLCMICFLS